MKADIFYLLLMPLQSSLPLGKLAPVPTKKDTPYFFDLDIEFLSVGEQQLMIEGVPIQVSCQVLDKQIWLAECHYQVSDIFSGTALTGKELIRPSLEKEFRRQQGYTGSFIEEYTIVALDQLEQAPDEFIDRHAVTFARWLRIVEKPLTAAETKEILSSRVHYSESDLTIVDWEGAIIITEDGEFQFDLALFKIGNYQLLRYRLLDRAIEKGLQQLWGYVNRKGPVWLPARYKTLRSIVEQRLALLLDFEKTDQSLLLIGDWYSARVYRLIVEQFSLDSWKAIVQTKIDNLVAINDIVYQDMAFSWQRLLDFVELIGWFILLVGYFILFFVELG